jgi:hypothetical protein
VGVGGGGIIGRRCWGLGVFALRVFLKGFLGWMIVMIGRFVSILKCEMSVRVL